MTPQEAIPIISTLVFRPGWKFHAETPPWWAHPDPYDIDVRAEVASFNTSYRNHAGVLSMPMTLAPAAVINVRDLDRAGLCHAILTRLVRPFDDHEDREFMRVSEPDGSWYAPLHPHHDAGKAAWARHAEERAVQCIVNAARPS